MSFELDANGSYPGYIRVGNGEDMFRYSVHYADLVPIALFVDSGGTSLYTLWEERQLPASFAQEAGFVRYPASGFVALELASTRYAHALHFVDTCQICMASSDTVLTEKINAGLTPGEDLRSAAGSSSESYVNVDIGVSFRLKQDSEQASVVGGINRLYWTMRSLASSDVAIRAARPLLDANGLAVQVDRGVAALSQEGTVDREIRLLMQGLDMRDLLKKEDAPIARQRLTDAHFLFSTLALLRSAKTATPEDWSVFMQAISSEIMVKLDRRPWELYTAAFCSLYEDAYECREWH